MTYPLWRWSLRWYLPSKYSQVIHKSISQLWLYKTPVKKKNQRCFGTFKNELDNSLIKLIAKIKRFDSSRHYLRKLDDLQILSFKYAFFNSCPIRLAYPLYCLQVATRTHWFCQNFSCPSKMFYQKILFWIIPNAPYERVAMPRPNRKSIPTLFPDLKYSGIRLPALMKP